MLTCVYVCVVAYINAIVYRHLNCVYVYVGRTGWHIQRIIFDYSLTLPLLTHTCPHCLETHQNQTTG